MKKYQLAFTVLDRALTTKRPHGAESTNKFSQWLRKLLPATHTVDACGNIHVDVRFKSSKTLFVAHVDTVHRTGGKNKVIKTDKKWSASGAPLGADDGAGVAILMHMIASGVPGYYIFTQGEEVGGVGAKWLAENKADLLRQFDRAIAFDRRATYSVITHQGFGRCCSDEFADALSDQFNRKGMLFASDDTGVYTDTAEFTHFIPECTNISAGYDMEHSDRETLDIEHFTDLVKNVSKVDWEALPVKRDPKAIESFSSFDWYRDYKRPAKAKTKAKGKGEYSFVADDDLKQRMKDIDGYRANVGKAETLSKWLVNGSSGDKEFDDAANMYYQDHFAEYDPDYDEASGDVELMQAIREAMDGDKNYLVTLIATHANCDSPRIAEKMINRRLMTEDFLCDMYDEAYVVTRHVLLNDAFENLGVMV